MLSRSLPALQARARLVLPPLAARCPPSATFHSGGQPAAPTTRGQYSGTYTAEVVEDDKSTAGQHRQSCPWVCFKQRHGRVARTVAMVASGLNYKHFVRGGIGLLLLYSGLTYYQDRQYSATFTNTNTPLYDFVAEHIEVQHLHNAVKYDQSSEATEDTRTKQIRSLKNLQYLLAFPSTSTKGLAFNELLEMHHKYGLLEDIARKYIDRYFLLTLSHNESFEDKIVRDNLYYEKFSTDKLKQATLESLYGKDEQDDKYNITLHYYDITEDAIFHELCKLSLPEYVKARGRGFLGLLRKALG